MKSEISVSSDTKCNLFHSDLFPLFQNKARVMLLNRGGKFLLVEVTGIP